MASVYERQSTQPAAELILARLAATQHGVFSKQQAEQLGISESVIHRRVKRGQWDRLYPATYRITAAVPTWRASLLAAVLAWGPGTLASHVAAAPLWRLATFDPGEIELTIPRGKQRSLPHKVHRPITFPAIDRTVVDAIPVTSPARTLIDLAATQPRDRVEEALDDALRRKLVTIARLRWRMNHEGRAGRAGIATLTELLDAREGIAVPRSRFETRLMRAIKRGGLPRPATQHRLEKDGKIAFVDFAYPRERLAIEADGFGFHSSRLSYQRDLDRRNMLTALGWRIHHVTWRALTTDEPGVVKAIATLLCRTPS